MKAFHLFPHLIPAIPNDREAFRIFHGPGITDHKPWSEISIDAFQNHLWITTWSKDWNNESLMSVIDDLKKWNKISIQSITWMDRSSHHPDTVAVPLLGSAPESELIVHEFSVPYSIRFQNVKHPGLFLDLAPLRKKLLDFSSGKKVLNLFAYTGSLSVACGRGNAEHVTTLDLSKATIEWAKRNWEIAALSMESADFIYGDALEWLPKLIKKERKFDLILCDPPSFSRSKKHFFSTQKDTTSLHAMLFQLLTPGGSLITSINTESIPAFQFQRRVEAGASEAKRRCQFIEHIKPDVSFPTLPGQEHYLKCLHFKA